MSGCTALGMITTIDVALRLHVIRYVESDIRCYKLCRNSTDVRLYSTRHGYEAQWSLNQSRQQPIALCSLSSQRLGFLDLSIEKLVEGGNQLLWWTLLDDGAHFVSKTY